jgi:HAD superfamily hydrolase (TIGR01509 family)
MSIRRPPGQQAAAALDAAPFDAVLFDIDGTLVDTSYLHAIAWRRGLADAGFDVPTAWIHHHLGKSADLLMGDLIGEERDDVKAGWRRHFNVLKPEIRAFAGAADLLREIRRRGMRVVLASSSEEGDVDALLAALGASDAIDCVISAGDVGEAKPSPEVFEVAMRKASCDPARTIVVGDTVWDVKAARRAGLDCIGVLTGGIARSELEAAGALAVYRDVGEILSRLDETPLVSLADRSVSLERLPAELRARVEAATAHAACRVIRQRGRERFEVHALAGDRFIHMDLALQPSGSVDEATETYLRDQIVVADDGPRTTIEVHDAGGRRFLSVPSEVQAAITASR